MVNKKQYADVGELKRRAWGRWPEIIVSVGGVAPELLDGQGHPCPRCGGDDRFSSFADFNETGGVICRQCHSKENGDGLATLRWLNGWSFNKTIEKLAKYLGGDQKPHTTTQRAAKDRLKKKTYRKYSTVDEAIGRSNTVVKRWTYHDKTGEPVMVAVRFDKADGKKSFLQISRCDGGWHCKAMEAPRPLYRLPEVLESEGPVYICEGEKATDAAVSIGLNATTSIGGSKTPHKTDWSTLAGRDVVILADNDDSGRKYANTVAENLILLDVRYDLPPSATVKVVELPGLPEKGDIVEWIEAQDTTDPEELQSRIEKLADEADQWQIEEEQAASDTTDSNQTKKNLSHVFPEEVASHVIESNFTTDGIVTLKHWRGDSYTWTGNSWQSLSQSEFDSKINKGLSQQYCNIKTAHFNDAKLNIRSIANLPDSTEPPSIIAGYDRQSVVSVVDKWNLRQAVFGLDGLLYLPWLSFRPSDCFIPASPIFFNTTSVACNVRPDSNTPEPKRWLKFLDSIWSDDPEAIEALRLWFGYLLTADTSQQKILLIVGPKRSGKGTIARVLQAIHRGSVAGPTLESLRQNFGLSGLLDKSIAIISDARLPNQDTATITERLLSISGEDYLQVDRKYRQPVNVRLGSRITIMSNELPSLRDTSGALASRMIILPMTRSFYGKENLGLEDLLKSELTSIYLVGGWWMG